MPAKGEIIFLNHEGNQLEGPREDQSSMIFEFNHEVRLPYDMDENKIAGNRKITAFSIVKEIDKVTPQLYDIVCNGRKCNQVLIKLYRIHADTGEEEEYFNYNLEDAKVVSVENYMPFTKVEANENIGHMEKVQMLAKKFTWSYLDGGVEYQEISL